MSIPLVINGATFEYPVDFDESWGVNATGWAQAVTNGMLQRAGGSFPLLADVNFGASFGLISTYYKSRAATIATAGTVRLASADPGVVFRNHLDSGNLVLTTDASDNLLYNGHILTASGASPVTSITGTANQVIASSSTGAVTLSTPQSIASSSTPTFAGETLNGALLMATTNAVQFQDNSSHTISMKSPTTTATYNLTLPPNAGSTGQFLRTDGAGTTTWVNATGSGTINSSSGNNVAFYSGTGTTLDGSSFFSSSEPKVTIQAASASSELDIISSAGNSSLVVLKANGLTNRMFTNTIGDFVLNDDDNSRDFLTYTRSTPGLSTVVPLDMGSHKITSVAEGTADSDAVNLGQVKTNLVQSTNTTTTVINSASYITAGITASITPSHSGSKVKISVTTNVNDAGAGNMSVTILRNGTTDLASTNTGFFKSSAASVVQPLSICFVDSPATTSSTSYTVYAKISSGSGSVNAGAATNIIVLEEIH